MSKPTLSERLRRMVPALARTMRFTHYYCANYWADPETRSGPGSRKDSPHVHHALEVLTIVTERYAIRSIADIPCGDFNWMGAYLAAWPGVNYRGFDIVAMLIDRNRRAYPGRRFDKLDIVIGVPPPNDLIFCKDLTNHLKDHEIVQAVAHMRESGSTYLLATNNFGYVNRPLMRSSRSSRHVDLTAAPFNYPQPIWHDHYLGLWPLATMVQSHGEHH
jgi:hypothetical protein